MLVLDAHCDAPSQMLRLRDFGADNPRGQVDFPKMKRGGVDASFFALYIPAELPVDQAREHMWRLLAELERQVAAAGLSAGDVRAAGSGAAGSGIDVRAARPAVDVWLAGSASDVRANKAAGRLSILIGLENGSPIGDDLSMISLLYERGVRYVTLTHSADNQLCDSCTGQGKWGGLSPLGREVVLEMNRVGMLVDVAHSSWKTIEDVLDLSTAPIVYTHGCCHALSAHRRNLPDSLLRGIAAGGGVVGMSVYPPFLSEEFCSVLAASRLEEKMWVEAEFIADPGNAAKASAWFKVQDELAMLPRPGVAKVVDHIEHAAAVCGIGGVGIGTDYDGIEVTADGLEDISKVGAIFAEMRRRRWPEADISAVAGENFLRLL